MSLVISYLRPSLPQGFVGFLAGRGAREISWCRGSAQTTQKRENAVAAGIQDGGAPCGQNAGSGSSGSKRLNKNNLFAPLKRDAPLVKVIGTMNAQLIVLQICAQRTKAMLTMLHHPTSTSRNSGYQWLSITQPVECWLNTANVKRLKLFEVSFFALSKIVLLDC